MKIDKFELPEDLYYKRRDHVWVKILSSGNVVLGLDDFGQQLSGHIKHIDTYPTGAEIKKNKTFGTIESGKYVGPIKSPINGKIIEVNETVLKNPKLLNESCYDNWILVAEPSNLEEDLSDLVHGEAIKKWIEEDIQDFQKRGYL